MTELQEGWAQAEAAWQGPPPAAPGPQADGSSDTEADVGAAAAGSASAADGKDSGQGEAAAQPAFRDAALAAWRAGDGGASGALPALLGAVEGAPAALEALSLDEFPRLLAWSEGLCGLTLLPLSLFGDSARAAAPWLAMGGRPCLVPLANLWLHRVSRVPPQLD